MFGTSAPGRDSVLGPEFKSLPPSSWGSTVTQFVESRPRLSEFQTPLVTIDAGRLDANLDFVAGWAADHGVELAPHGKTTMAPTLWRRQLDAGAWAITLATLWQAQVGRAFGVERIVLANEAIDPVGLRWLASELDAHPEFDVYCWVDSVDAVTHMTDVLAAAGARRQVNVLVEMGRTGARTGVRTVEQGVAVAEAVASSDRLSLVGVGGYEGAMSHDRTDSGVAAVRDYLTSLAALHRRLDYPGDAIVSAGGSAFPDLVVDALAPLADDATTVVLRSGANLAHDDGYYAGVSPFGGGLRAAIHGWARVLSRPEPGLSLLDGGKRDFPYDEGLPTPQNAAGEIVAFADQHAFLRSDAPPAVGDVVRMGLSHPCTTFDKWRAIPVIDDADAPDPTVVDLVRTYF